MYQQEMFARVIKTKRFLGDGAFGQVHAICDEWVVKYSKKDGTLNYLEWCLWMQRAGKGMKGMPEVDTIVHLDGGQYMVTMRRYARTMSDSGLTYSERDEKVFEAEWYEELKDAYLAYHEDMLEDVAEDSQGFAKRDPWDDCHGGNVMFDERTDSWVVTDPCSGPYRLQRSAFPATMYVEQYDKQEPQEVRPKQQRIKPIMPYYHGKRRW